MPPRISKVEKDDPTSEFATDITIDPNALVHAPVYPKDPGRITPVSEETRYIAIIEQKLILARDFIHNEISLNLDLDRNMQKDKTAMLLAEPPILFSLYCQECIRDVVKLQRELVGAPRDEMVDAPEEEEVRGKFEEAWREIKSVVTVLMPGESHAVKEERAERVMVNVFGGAGG